MNRNFRRRENSKIASPSKDPVNAHGNIAVARYVSIRKTKKSDYSWILKNSMHTREKIMLLTLKKR